jgi:hydrogenase maturation protease
VKVIAVGNAFCGDDGVGAAVLAQLAAAPAVAGTELVDLELIDLGMDALALIDVLEPGRRHIVIDAARMDREPGAVVAFRPREARLRIRGDGLSLHGLGLAEAFGLAEKLGRLPDDVLVIGVEPAQTDIGSGLSDAAAAAVPRVVSLIQAEVLGHE